MAPLVDELREGFAGLGEFVSDFAAASRQELDQQRPFMVEQAMEFARSHLQGFGEAAAAIVEDARHVAHPFRDGSHGLFDPAPERGLGFGTPCPDRARELRDGRVEGLPQRVDLPRECALDVLPPCTQHLVETVVRLVETALHHVGMRLNGLLDPRRAFRERAVEVDRSRLEIAVERLGRGVEQRLQRLGPRPERRVEIFRSRWQAPPGERRPRDPTAPARSPHRPIQQVAEGCHLRRERGFEFHRSIHEDVVDFG